MSDLKLQPVPVYPEMVKKEACEICWTNSWEPVPGGYHCAHCFQHNEWTKALATLAAVRELPAKWRAIYVANAHLDEDEYDKALTALATELADELEAALKQEEADESTTG